MLKTQFILALGCTVVFLAACGGATAPQPASATLNGVSKLDREAGKAELSVSALNETGDLLEQGSLSAVSATVNEADINVSAGVCGTGQIESRGDLRAVLSLDGSGSMSVNDPEKNRASASKQFVARMSSSDLAAVSSFSGGSEIPMWQTLTADKALLDEAIDKATSARGGTNLWGAAVASINYLAEESGTNKVAVILTDGRDTSSRSNPEEVIALANEKGISVFMIGLGDERRINVTAMTDVASATNGFYRNVADSSGLDSLFDTALNASKAAGCIDITFDPVPVSGQTVTGELEFSINGKAFASEYSVNF